MTDKIRKQAVHERTCLICYSDSVEDEFHFVFNCNKYSKYSLPCQFVPADYCN